MDLDDWPTWKHYIAITHPAVYQIMGTKGIIAVNIEELEGVIDPNRGGARRVDIVCILAATQK